MYICILLFLQIIYIPVEWMDSHGVGEGRGLRRGPGRRSAGRLGGRGLGRGGALDLSVDNDQGVDAPIHSFKE
jgi:hypothetical protein